ncbi:GCN5-like 1 domain-containing protein [Planoprotostelium fungivorum]|uniref:Biogenesis of lysosome-related organelles complex 1 subunit 1 n=1 Tax=Planoprotostelium fungivorum TaxID=1890364 RepID=A0A2P6N454_9EUKA|nr:GCN5-like 1 domain-containing protein [Planoprotostelium fungivorum]
MLSKLVKEHQVRTSRLREENEIKRKVALSSVGTATVEMLDAVNGGVADIFNNQKKIEAESRNLQVQTQRFSKQSAQWLSLVNNFNESLKEIGDIENWGKTIENDMTSIARTLDFAAKQATSE